MIPHPTFCPHGAARGRKAKRIQTNPPRKTRLSLLVSPPVNPDELLVVRIAEPQFSLECAVHRLADPSREVLIGGLHLNPVPGDDNAHYPLERPLRLLRFLHVSYGVNNFIAV